MSLFTYSTYFSSGGGGISCVDGHRGGVFSLSIIASGASGSGIGLTEFVSIFSLIRRFNQSFVNQSLFDCTCARNKITTF